MRHSYKIFFVCVTTFVLLLAFIPRNALATSKAEYATEVRIKLLPADSPLVSNSGSYAWVNLDDGSTISTTPSYRVSVKENKVVLEEGKTSYSSVKGFALEEISPSSTNSFTIDQIQTARGNVATTYRGSLLVQPKNGKLLLINILEMEDYLKGVVPSEMPASWEMEALKAQAVAARSYAYGQLKSSAGKGYLEMTVASQVYGGKTAEHPRGNEAVNATKNVYALYDGQPITAYFHASSGGYTENSEDVWTYPVPYIRAVPDPYDNSSGGNYNYDWQAIGTSSAISNALKLTDDQTLLNIKVTQRSTGGSAQQVTATLYNDQKKSFETKEVVPTLASNPDRLRNTLGLSLKSTKFSISTDDSIQVKTVNGTVESTSYLKGLSIRGADGSDTPILDDTLSVRTSKGQTYLATSPDQFYFNGNGWGHGLGMSQWGARGMASQGKTYEEILKYYFTGIEVKVWTPKEIF